MDDSRRCRVEALGLFSGVWQGGKVNRTGYWLRWWDTERRLLHWGLEKVAAVEWQVKQERERAERLAEKL